MGTNKKAYSESTDSKQLKSKKKDDLRPGGRPGIKIKPRSAPDASPERIRRVSNKVKKVGESRCLAAKVTVNERKAQGLPVYDFGLGEAKGKTPDYLLQAGSSAFLGNHSGYPDSAGLYELREEVLNWLDLQEHYQPENVTISVGAKQAILNVVLASCDVGDVALFDTAPWVSYRPMCFCSGVTPVCIQPSRGKASYLKISADDLIRELQIHPHARMLLVNSPCNPTGQIYTTDELNELLNICAEHQVYFVLDRLYWKTVFDGKHFPTPTVTEKTKPWLINIDAISKAWRSVGGLRVGWSVAELDIAKAMQGIQSHITSGTASVSQYAALVALREEFPTEMRESLQSNLDILRQYLPRIPLIEAFPTEGGFYTFWDITKTFGKKTPSGTVIKSSDDFASYLLESEGVVVLSGSAFLKDGYVRICFHVPEVELCEGLEAISRAVSNLS